MYHQLRPSEAKIIQQACTTTTHCLNLLPQLYFKIYGAENIWFGTIVSKYEEQRN